MTNNADDNIDVDIDAQDSSADAKPSLKETFDSNPLLKVAAGVVALVVAYGAYAMVFSGDEETEATTKILSNSGQGVSSTPGTEAADAAYTEAVKDQNQKDLEAAKGGVRSFIPTPIDEAKGTDIDVPEDGSAAVDDPLKEWRRTMEARKLSVDDTREMTDDPATAAAPEFVPVAPVTPKPVVQTDPEQAKALAGQMRTIITAQAPGDAKSVVVTAEDSEYVRLKRDLEEQKKKQESASLEGGAGTGSGGTSGAGAAKDDVIVPAGQIAYAQTLTEANSDVPGPVLAHIMSGPFEGARVLGSFEKNNAGTKNAEYITIRFKTVVKEGVSYKIDGIALDEATTLPANRTDIDRHYFANIILPAAAAFIEGYGSAVAETGTTVTTTSGGGTATAQPEPDATEELYKGVEESSKKLSEIVDENAGRDATITVARGTTFGLLFLDTVDTGDVSK